MAGKEKENRVPRPVFAKKSFGQNFLTDQNYIRKIVEAVNPQPEDVIVEIGPGRGALTERLLASGATVIAIELDRDLIPLLADKFAGEDNLRLISADVLKFEFNSVAPTDGRLLKLAANLPYYISTAILQYLLGQRFLFQSMTLMFQREVVERIAAPPGNSERGFLTVLVEAFLSVDKLFEIPPQAFRPVPKVWSSVVELRPVQSGIDTDREEVFRELVSAGFRQKRKTILNNLKSARPSLTERAGGADSLLKAAGVDPSRRAETLSLGDWIAILRNV